jgi:hypothetical protein
MLAFVVHGSRPSRLEAGTGSVGLATRSSITTRVADAGDTRIRSINRRRLESSTLAKSACHLAMVTAFACTSSELTDPPEVVHGAANVPGLRTHGPIAVPQSERRPGLSEEPTPRLSLVVGPMERPAAMRAACRGHLPRQLLVPSHQSLKILQIQPQIGHHRTPPSLATWRRTPRRIIEFSEGFRLSAPQRTRFECTPSPSSCVLPLRAASPSSWSVCVPFGHWARADTRTRSRRLSDWHDLRAPAGDQPGPQEPRLHVMEASAATRRPNDMRHCPDRTRSTGPSRSCNVRVRQRLLRCMQ